MSVDVDEWFQVLPVVVIGTERYEVQLPDRREWRDVARLIDQAGTAAACEFALRRVCRLLGLPAEPVLALPAWERTTVLRRLLDRVEDAYRRSRPTWWQRVTAFLGGHHDT